MSGGRPTAYEEEFAGQAEKLCALGATDDDLAEFFDVSTRTIYRWKIEHEKFCQALKVGKDVADERVVRSLYNRAVGYTFDSEKIMAVSQGKDLGSEVQRIPCKEHVAPDVTAAIFWLKNRRGAEWRDKIDHDVRVEPINVNINLG